MSVGEIVGGVAVMAVAAAIAPFGHLALALVGVAADVIDRDRATPARDDTTAPVQTADGSVMCTRCGEAVPYASMSLNQHGYFCATCGPSQPTAA